MRESDDSFNLLLLVAGVYLLRQFLPDGAINKAAQKGGASLYEAVHPDEVNHADDLPGKALSKKQIVALARDTGFPDPNLAAAVAMAESAGYPGALGDSGQSVGLWQIHLPNHPSYTKAQLRDPRQNARAAFSISKAGREWKWWSTYNSGAFKRYL